MIKRASSILDGRKEGREGGRESWTIREKGEVTDFVTLQNHLGSI